MKKGLGKGLDALISSTNTLEESKNNVLELKINDVEPNHEQPRKVFDQEKLEILAESIKEHGVVQPIIVKKDGQRYIIVAGERRWRASKIAGLKTIPVVIKDLTYREVMEIALIENLQREDLNPIEEAEAYQKLMDEFNLTQEEVAKIAGKSRAAVANSIRLLNLSQDIKNMILDRKLTSGHARTLITINDPNKQIELANKIVENNLNVRETELLASQEEKKNNTPKKLNIKKQAVVSDLEEKLREVYGTKIDFIRGKEKGKIVLEYYSNDEFERIIDLLLNNGK